MCLICWGTDCDTNTISYRVAVDDLIALQSLDAGTDGVPSFYLTNNSLADNVVDSLQHGDDGDHIRIRSMRAFPTSTR